LRLCEQFTVHVLAGDFEHRDFGQLAGPRIALLAIAGDDAVLIELFQNALQRDAVGAFDVQQPREIALGSAGFRRERFKNARLVEAGRVAALTLLRRFTPRVRVFSAW
jgi:hypothetical protein